jgi:hypothetical protein
MKYGSMQNKNIAMNAGTIKQFKAAPKTKPSTPAKKVTIQTPILIQIPRVSLFYEMY